MKKDANAIKDFMGQVSFPLVEQDFQGEQKGYLVDKFNPETMRKDIVRWVTEAKTHYSSRFKAVDEYVKRYEAKRSISGLMGWGDDAQANPKNSPWNNCYTPDTEILTKKGWISIKILQHLIWFIQ